MRYQWLLNGLQIGGADEASYSTPSLTLADSGAVYSVIVYNSAGLEFSQSAVLTVQALVPPSVSQQPADVTIEAGASANLCVAFGGTPPFAVQMSRWSGSAWTPTGGRVTMNDNTSNCVSTPVLQSADNGAQFRFSANNAEGRRPKP